MLDEGWVLAGGARVHNEPWIGFHELWMSDGFMLVICFELTHP